MPAASIRPTGLAPGTYRIVEIGDAAGYLDGLDAAGTVAGCRRCGRQPGRPRSSRSSWAAGQAGVDYNFGELVPATIRGHVRLADADGDCYVAGAAERPVAGRRRSSCCDAPAS